MRETWYNKISSRIDSIFGTQVLGMEEAAKRVRETGSLCGTLALTFLLFTNTHPQPHSTPRASLGGTQSHGGLKKRSEGRENHVQRKEFLNDKKTVLCAVRPYYFWNAPAA